MFLLRYGLRDEFGRRLVRVWVPLTEFGEWKHQVCSEKELTSGTHLFCSEEELAEELCLVIRKRLTLSSPVVCYVYWGYLEVWILTKKIPAEDLYCELVTIFRQLTVLC